MRYFLGLLSALILVPVLVLAADAPKDSSKIPCPDNPNRECIRLENPFLNESAGPNELLGGIIKAALGVVGALTLLMLVWGGFQWLTSAGNSEKVEKGTQTMIWAVIGVFLVFASYLIVSTFTDYLTGAK